MGTWRESSVRTPRRKARETPALPTLAPRAPAPGREAVNGCCPAIQCVFCRGPEQTNQCHGRHAAVGAAASSPQSDREMRVGEGRDCSDAGEV